MDYIAEIKSRMNIVELAGRLGLEIVRHGSNLFIRSIYGPDNNPSLCLYPDKNRFIDYSSGNKGDLIDLYKDFYHLDTAQAIEELCKLLGIERNYSAQANTPSEKPLPGKAFEKPLVEAFTSGLVKSLSDSECEYLRSQLRKILDLDLSEIIEINNKLEADIKNLESVIKKTLQMRRLETNKLIFSELYYYCRMKGQDQSALVYLTQERKLSADALKTFRLFTIANYNEVNNHMKKTFSLGDLQRSGLYNKKGNLIFFQHRIIIPYLHKGEIVYLRGRYFDINGNSKTDQSKYIGLGNDGLSLNGTRRFFNSDVLKTMLPNEKLYIVEGEFDCIVLSAMGYNALCIPGASNIPDFVKFRPLERFNVVLCVDNDAAGQELQRQLAGIFRNMNKTIKIKKLDTKDINDFVVKHG